MERATKVYCDGTKHYKMSNENFKHHENQEKVEGGLTRTFQGTLFLILLCELNGPVEFRNHIFLRLCHENYVHLTLQTMFIFEKKPKKNRCPCNYLGNGSKNVFVRVELIFPLFCLFQGKNHNSNRSPQSRRHRWVQCHSLNGTGSLSPITLLSTAPLGSIYRMSPHTKVNGTVGFEVPLDLTPVLESTSL